MPVAKPLSFLIAVNPISGGSDKTELIAETEQHLKSAGHSYNSHYLDGETDKEELKRLIEEHKPDRVLAVGGDGTLKLVAELLIGRDIPIGLIPAGSANGMARELGIPTQLQDCLKVIDSGNIRALDVLMINDQEVCLHLSDIGFNAHLVREFEKSDGRGKFTYFRHAFRVLLMKKQLKVVIKTNGKEYARRAFMIVLANARMYGTGAMINPEGNLCDGLMEIIVLKKISFWELCKMFLKYRNFNPQKTEIIQCAEVKIISARDAFFQVDGEYFGKTYEVSARVQAGAVKMILPVEAVTG